LDFFRKNGDRLEAACQRLLDMRGYPTYSTLKRLMAAISSDADKPVPAARTTKPAQHAAPPADVSVHGSDYYREGR
jgi:hypothetical protein